MAVKYRSRIPEVDWDNPQAWGRDDLTGLPVMHNDMVKVMEYGPQGLYWTGFLSHFKDADEPNPQLVPPRLRPDPVPVPNPRYFARPELPQIPTGLAEVSRGETTITVTWDLVVLDVDSYVILCTSEHTSFNFPGVVTPPYTITSLAPGNTYAIQIASTNDDVGTSAFSSPPILVTTS